MNNSKLFSIFFLLFLFAMFSSSSSSNNIHKCQKKQSEALLLFKHDFSPMSYTIDYCIYSYPITMNWNTSTDCCIWKGVTCDNSTGDVIGLDLNCGMLRGTIHPNSSLFNLPHLQTLNLAFNDFFVSQIPSEIGRFSNSLTHLNLSGCWLSGQVPPDITLLHKLVSLDLSSYRVDDLKLEPHVFINMLRNFTNLEELSLTYVNISSVLPTSLNISSSLKLLELSSTRLQGKLPHYIFNLQSLETLDLSGNHFTGDIPSKISLNLTHLTFMGLSSNNLNGTFPSWLFTSPSLEYLFLGYNMLSGNVPFDMQTFRQLTNLTRFQLSFNNFSGELELDTLLSSLTKLEYLDLSYSGFSVTTNNANHYVNPGFQLLYLASCKLKVFPESFRAMKQLQELDLSGNEIHGQIPHWAGEIGDPVPSLQVLVSNQNNFQGTFNTLVWENPHFPVLKFSDLYPHNGFVGENKSGPLRAFSTAIPINETISWGVSKESQFNTFDNAVAGIWTCGFPLPKRVYQKPQLEEHENHEDKSDLRGSDEGQARRRAMYDAANTWEYDTHYRTIGAELNRSERDVASQTGIDESGQALGV
ncbi:leucine-rich repeat-containing protein [Tanacetum coccineum]